MLVLFCACLVCFVLSAPVALAAAEASVIPGALLGVAMTAGVFFAVYGRRVRQRSSCASRRHASCAPCMMAFPLNQGGSFL